MSRVRRATAQDLDLARDWLSQAQLPSADLTPEHMEHFLVAMDGDTPAGMVGIEIFGDVGLLRSLVVDPGCRSGGIGAELVAALEAMAGESGIRELWLLTIDADRYFARLGFTVRPRDEAPAAIRETKEFSLLCPDDAILMSKR